MFFRIFCLYPPCNVLSSPLRGAAGAYESVSSLSKTAPTSVTKDPRATISNELRFSPGLGDYTLSKSTSMAAQSVGPGSYTVGGSMVKRSYNINFAM